MEPGFQDDALVRRAALILRLRSIGVRDRDVLRAIETVPRERFVPEEFRDVAYEDQALPIGGGQTISAPSVVALMTDALELTPRSQVLEVGTGSGYQTAVLARLARRVTTIERDRRLHRQAIDRFEALGLRNVSAVVADGREGWSRQAPFDAIMVTAAMPEVPHRLIEQLAEGGRLVVPIGEADQEQRLTLFVRGSEVETRDLGAVLFVPIGEGLSPRS